MMATADCAIVDIQGVGYSISIPARLHAQLPQEGASVLFYTSFVLREASQTLYGFLTKGERDLFELLIQVSGVGPKLALSLIGYLSIQELRQALVEENSSLLCKVPGVGRKTAERLMLELKDKLIRFPDAPSLPENDTFSSSSQNRKVEDAIAALIHLGYQQTLAQKAVQQGLNALPSEADLPTLITSALRHCTSQR